MRKFYLLSGLLFCLSLNSYSQSTTNVGFKGGLSLGNAEISSFSSGSIEAETEFRPSVYAGFLVEYSLEGISEDLYAQLELQYVNSGAVAKATADVPETTTHLSQLTLPFVVKYRIVRPVLITAGIYWGLLLKVEQEAENGTASDVTEDFETFDSGLLIGAEVPLGENFFLEARYNYGLLDIMDLEKTNNRGSYFNRFLQLGVGFNF